jgi:hypothetical protein
MNMMIDRTRATGFRAGTMAVLAVLFAVLTGVEALGQGTVRVEGVISDEVTGKPVGCKIDVTNAEGKKVLTLSSNDKDGSYLMVLNEPGTMKITFRGHGVFRRESTLEVPKTERFKEVKQDYRVRGVYQGTQLMAVRGFERNAAVLSGQGRTSIAELQNLLRDNGELRVEITVSPDEDQVQLLRAAAQAQYAKDMAAWNAAKKKLKKGKEAPPEPVLPADPSDPNSNLAQERMAAVKEALKDVKNGDLRLTYVAAPLPAGASAPAPPAAPQATTAAVKGKKGAKAPAAQAAPQAQMAQATTHSTLVVTIGKVKKLFD